MLPTLLSSLLSLFQLEILYCSTMKLSRKFWAFCSTDFCNFLDKSQAICLENCINLSCKNSQNVLDQFHCRTIKFLVENSFWSAHSVSYPTKYHFEALFEVFNLYINKIYSNHLEELKWDLNDLCLKS